MSSITAKGAQKLVDNTVEDPRVHQPLILGGHDFTTLTDRVCAVVESKTVPKAWGIALGLSTILTLILFAMLYHLVTTGVGVWGNNIPVAWAFDITNFVFWIGIGHAGTLISAILYLLRQ